MAKLFWAPLAVCFFFSVGNFSVYNQLLRCQKLKKILWNYIDANDFITKTKLTIYTWDRWVWWCCNLFINVFFVHDISNDLSTLDISQYLCIWLWLSRTQQGSFPSSHHEGHVAFQIFHVNIVISACYIFCGEEYFMPCFQINDFKFDNLMNAISKRIKWIKLESQIIISVWAFFTERRSLSHVLEDNQPKHYKLDQAWRKSSSNIIFLGQTCQTNFSSIHWRKLNWLTHLSQFWNTEA